MSAITLSPLPDLPAVLPPWDLVALLPDLGGAQQDVVGDADFFE